MITINDTIKEEVINFYNKERVKDTHKGDYGRVYIIAGSKGMTGAAALCSMAALRSGCGLSYIVTKVASMPVYETLVPEAVKICVTSDKSNDYFTVEDVDTIFDNIKNPACIVIGPGLGNNIKTKQFVRRFLKRYNISGLNNIPIIIDADAINSFADRLGLLADCVNENCVITPHCMEASVLSGQSLDYICENREAFVADLVKKLGCTVVLKGNKTLIGCPGKQNDVVIYRNTSGNPGMATGGSGDVLAGIISGFIATDSKIDGVFNCARYGVYVHGMCGDIAMEKYGQRFITATFLIDQLGEIHRRGY